MSDEVSVITAVIGAPPRRLVVRVFDDGTIEVRTFKMDDDGDIVGEPTDTLSLHSVDVDTLVGALNQAVRLAHGGAA